jgi:hypothetical protein
LLELLPLALRQLSALFDHFSASLPPNPAECLPIPAVFTHFLGIPFTATARPVTQMEVQFHISSKKLSSPIPSARQVHQVALRELARIRQGEPVSSKVAVHFAS